ncbi:MAG: hypothetical protein K2H35_04000, partial [Muribaculaceae bacterium]|nr:hypothetical protein [Muribaculaceae bacterium]
PPPTSPPSPSSPRPSEALREVFSACAYQPKSSVQFPSTVLRRFCVRKNHPIAENYSRSVHFDN